MSVEALFNTTQALRLRIVDAIGNQSVHVGAPGSNNSAMVSLTLFDIHPSAALRNTPRIVAPPSSGPVTGPGRPVEAIALELRYLIVCNRKSSGEDAFPDELQAMGRIVAALQYDPVLSVSANPEEEASPVEQEAALSEQVVRLSLESYGLDDWNRLWALFPSQSFLTSIVYLASPVYIIAGETALYPRVQERRLDGGLLPDPPVLSDRDAA